MSLLAVVLTLSIAADDAATKLDIEDLVKGASAYTEQLGVHLELQSVSIGVRMPANLDAAKLLKTLGGTNHGGAHVLVLLTRQTLRIVPWTYRGAATGSACRAAQVLVHIERDGLDAVALAHEIAHTLGATHDPEPYMIMAPRVSEQASEFSARTIKQTRAAIRCLLRR